MITDDMSDIFKRLMHADDVNLSVFLAAGYPNMTACGHLIELLARHPAVSFVELGMPFSDPLADGPTIQRASEISLAQGTRLDDVLSLSKQFRSICDKPLMLMGYCNPVYRRGVERFVKEARAAGASGLILPDLPYESYSRDFAEALGQEGLSMSFFVSPTSTKEGIERAFETSTAFVYGVANVGMTGDIPSMDRGDFFRGLQNHRARCPIVAGFGIATPEDVNGLTGLVDGAIVGSAFLRAIEPKNESLLDTTSIVQRAEDFLEPFNLNIK